jgi:hypothetical protein
VAWPGVTRGGNFLCLQWQVRLYLTFLGEGDAVLTEDEAKEVGSHLVSQREDPQRGLCTWDVIEEFVFKVAEEG